ncbi:MAG: 3-deoxy-manno-octulosonate cytidylyltransferase [Chthoniobacterales bacterium]
MKTAIIIPARWKSTRFPGKPLHCIAGKPLVQHVWERCCKARSVDSVIVATDDWKIARACFDFGAEVSMTSPKHTTGTDRIAEVAKRLRGFTNILNVQGDEPLIDPKLIDRLARVLQTKSEVAMVTAACPFKKVSEAENPNNVKVVTDKKGDALYFSRSIIPFDRDGGGGSSFLRHLGIYGYRRDVLLQFVKWKPTPLEELEKLEQLRALEYGVKIRVLQTFAGGIGVDTPEDARMAQRLLSKGAKKR